jgi:hypothetical protein
VKKKRPRDEAVSQVPEESGNEDESYEKGKESAMKKQKQNVQAQLLESLRAEEAKRRQKKKKNKKSISSST